MKLKILHWLIFHSSFSGSNGYGWWFSTENDTYDPLNPTDISKGYDESLELVKATFANQVCMWKIIFSPIGLEHKGRVFRSHYSIFCHYYIVPTLRKITVLLAKILAVKY